jgi:hypothetical protein
VVPKTAGSFLELTRDSTSRAIRPILVALGYLIIPACGGGSSDSGSAPQPDPAPTMVPDFHLVDLNPNSPTYNKTASPRDFLGMVPAYYFTHAN